MRFPRIKIQLEHWGSDSRVEVKGSAGGKVSREKRKRGRKPLEEKLELPNMLHECILEGMKNTLGESGMQAALFHLQLVQYARNPKDFHDNLYAIFKDGAVTLEKMIVKELFRRLGVPYQESGAFDFERFVNLAKEILSTRMMRNKLR